MSEKKYIYKYDVSICKEVLKSIFFRENDEKKYLPNKHIIEAQRGDKEKMRGSLRGGSGGMGGGGGSGGMLKNVHRAVRAGVGGGGAAQEQPFSPFKTPRKHTVNNLPPHGSNLLTLSTAANVAPPSGAGPSRCSSPVCGEESEWECVDGREDEEMGNYFYDDYVFGTVPSLDEVHHAFSALQQ